MVILLRKARISPGSLLPRLPFFGRGFVHEHRTTGKVLGQCAVVRRGDKLGELASGDFVNAGIPGTSDANEVTFIRPHSVLSGRDENEFHPDRIGDCR